MLELNLEQDVGAPHPAVNFSQQRAVIHSRPACQDWLILAANEVRSHFEKLKAKSQHWFFDDIFCTYLHQLWRQVALK